LAVVWVTGPDVAGPGLCRNLLLHRQPLDPVSDDFNIDSPIRLQAGDDLRALGALAFSSLGDRLRFAPAFRGHATGSNSLTD
jgi:hypothetical protein